ncbi:MAG: hypothetical protein KBD17_02900 [Candidatus Pacebacteria bacterium]|nr:hypothetical protein [Candidatus Paceibacterota bacterium]
MSDPLDTAAKAYSASTLKNACEFAGILSSYLLQNRLLRGIHEYYSLQITLVMQLYIFAIHASGYLVFEKLGQEKHDIFMERMLNSFLEDAPGEISIFLSESEAGITVETVKSATQNLIEFYNTSARLLRIKTNDMKDFSAAALTELVQRQFIESGGYGNLIELNESSRERILPTIKDMLDSFGLEFQKDVNTKLSSF